MAGAEDRFKAALADRYSIESEIDTGGMATVYRARDLKHDRTVAIKVLRPDLAEAIGADRFLREIRTTANLSHPHILPLHDSGEAAGFLFYVMPLVRGESLRDRLERERLLPVEDAVRIAREVADALSYAHEEGIIHRDIKPANIMLERDHALLADFGIAQAKAGAEETRLTGTGMSLGTPSYMSPEQITGDQELDGRADQYALACVLYEMLAGEPPFPGANIPTLLRQHLAVAPPPLREALPSVPEEVAAGVARALAKDPDERFATTAAFREALNPQRDSGKSRDGPTRQWVVRHRAAVVLLGVLASGAILVGVGQGLRARAGDSAVYLSKLAVLPCEDRGGDSAQAFMAAGVHDEMVTELERISTVEVRGRQSVTHYRDLAVPRDEMARELGVDGFVECSIYPAPHDSIRVLVSLRDAPEDRHLWSESYQRSVDEVFLLGTDAATGLAAALRASGTPQTGTPTERHLSENQEAVQHYRRGYYLAFQWTEDGINRGIEHLEQAIALDPTFALAYASLSEAMMFQGDAVGSDADIRPADFMPRARELVLRALELDDGLAEAHRVLGWIRWCYDYDYVAAEREGRISVELDPTSAAAWSNYGTALSVMGLHDRAIQAFTRAVELDPVTSWILSDFSWALLMVGRFQEALDRASEAMELSPTSAPATSNAADALLLMGRQEEAHELYEHIRESSVNPWYWVRGAIAEARGGDADPALLALRELQETARSRYVPPRAFAALYTSLDSLDAAVDWLMRAVDARDPGAQWELLHPFGQSLRTHPRFPELLRVMRLER